MDLKGLENALNNGNFKEQVYSSLEGVYQISKVLNQLDLLKNFSDHDLEIVGKVEAIKPQIQGVTKFLGIYVYGRQTLFKNESDEFIELFEFANIHLEANKSYIVQFSMPYELATNGLYSDSMGEMVLSLKANSKAYPILNSFYQNKSASLSSGKIIDTYRTNCIFETPSEQADYKIAVFARKHKDLWVNVNYTANTSGFEVSFLNSAKFRDLTTQSIATTYNNDWVFYKHSQAIVYEIVK